MFQELEFYEIKAAGWAKRYLETQATGQTGELGSIGFPFSDPSWDKGKVTLRENDDYFVGGMQTSSNSWVPFEQTGYWIDGAIRAGHLADNEKLLRLARKKIYPAIENAGEDGYIGPEFLRDGTTWSHAVYFRALIAEYSATRDSKILEALKAHFLRRPIRESYEGNIKPLIAVRSSAEIETILWIYGQTGDQRFLEMAEESYDIFNRLFSDDTGVHPNAQMRDVTLPGMLGNRKVQRNHGVTYCEICKLAAILHLYTGKEAYKKAAVHAFDKVYRDQMIIDGCFSSTEYLNGNSDSQAMHETCVVADFTWALGYLYRITGNTKYGDWIEDCIFNAGLGANDDDFKGNQYFSCPNQVVANDHSNHAKFYKGSDWHSYSPRQILGCCAGNVNRMMPNFVYHSWMRDGNCLAVVTYCPSKICVELDGKAVTVEEITKYPYENTILFRVSTPKPVSFSLRLRRPDWAVSADLAVNGEKIPFEQKVIVIERSFANGDEILLSFADEIRLIENARGISVKKGPLLYALPVQEERVVEGLKDCGNPEFPHYSLYPKSKWNYGLCVDAAEDFTFAEGQLGEEPWRREQNGLGIQVTVKEVKDWKLRRVKRLQRNLLPRVKCQWVDMEGTFTPKVFPVKKEDALGEERRVTLVPYGTTRLRIAIFPLIKNN